MRVSTRIAAGFGFLMVIVVALLSYHVRTIRDAVSTSFELTALSSRLALGSTQLLGRLNQMEDDARKYWVTRDAGYLERFAGALDAFDATVTELAAEPLGADERREVVLLTDAWAGFRPIGRQFVADGRADAFSARADPLPILQAHVTRLRQQTRRVSDASEALMAARLARSAQTARRVERVSWAAAALALLLSTLVSVLVVRSISRALARLKSGTRAVAAGDFAHRLPVDRDDEFAELAADFNVMTRRLGELEQMQRDFLSHVSHDLKTPLASMQETTRALLDEVSGTLTPTQRRLLQLGQESGRRLGSMIANILDLSTMEAGGLRLATGRHAVAPLARQALEQLEPLAAERGVRLRLAAAEPEAQLNCDADRVVQLLVNLLDNAIKFSPPGGAVVLAARALAGPPAVVAEARWARCVRDAAAGAVLLSVCDDGPGVAPAERERIFGRFVQTEEGRRIRGRGVGLGLPICRELAAAHGGDVWAAEAPGGGAAFHVLLPALAPAESAPRPAVAAASH